MIALRMLETHSNEGKVKLSLLPIRLNCDQDTIDFLQDFFAELSTNIAMPKKRLLHLFIGICVDHF
jgi:hypothetical protein